MHITSDRHFNLVYLKSILSHEVGKCKEVCLLDGELRSSDAHLSGEPFLPINGNLHNLCLAQFWR